MADDVILQKVENLERCLQRLEETFSAHPNALKTDYDVQDIINLNLQRACQISIDIALHIVRQKQLGLPKESREAFTLLETANIISPDLCDNLGKMGGLRNILVHEYSDIDYDILESVLETKLVYFRDFARIALRAKIENTP